MSSATIFSTFIASIIGLFITLLFTHSIIRLMKKLKLGQYIRTWGPTLHQHKSGTPTMGGLAILVGLGCSICYLWFQVPSIRNYLTLILISTFGFGLIGIVDDLISLRAGKSKGLGAIQKIIGQCVVSVVFLYFAIELLESPVQIMIPFRINEIVLPVYLFYVIVLVIVVGTVNSLNLTDGLDGLAIGATIVTIVGFTVFVTPCLLAALIPFIAVGIVFFWFNFHPAKVFMGDTGAFALGGFIGAVTVITRSELYLPFLGFLFFLDALSVIVQVTYYKVCGRRIFKISPLHHHFEKATGIDYEYLLPNLEWDEPLITARLLVLHSLAVGAGVFIYFYWTPV